MRKLKSYLRQKPRVSFYQEENTNRSPLFHLLLSLLTLSLPLCSPHHGCWYPLPLLPPDLWLDFLRLGPPLGIKHVQQT
jgi:hypothetical protein